jgi:hypothetical protein
MTDLSWFIVDLSLFVADFGRKMGKFSQLLAVLGQNHQKSGFFIFDEGGWSKRANFGLWPIRPVRMEWRDSVLDCAGPPALFVGTACLQSGRGLPQSKTIRFFKADRFIRQRHRALPRHKLTTLDNGLVIIVRRSPLLQFGVMVELQP